MEFTKLLEERRSIRAFDPEKHVTAEQIQEIVQAAKLAHSDSFIRRLPQGYDTVIAEDGGNLSQGQKQLLTIAKPILSFIIIFYIALLLSTVSLINKLSLISLLYEPLYFFAISAIIF